MSSHLPPKVSRRALLSAASLVPLLGSTSTAGGSVGDGVSPFGDAAGALMQDAALLAPSLRREGPPTGVRATLESRVAKVIGDSDSIGVSVLDRTSSQRWSVNGRYLTRTGSASKVLIVAAALRKARAAGDSLSTRQKEMARQAITLSSNGPAYSLYSWVGGHDALMGLCQELGMTATVRAPEAGDWGTLQTCADDLRLLMAQITAGHVALHPDDATYLLGLMGQVVSYQRWGVGTVRTGSVKTRQKNGWMAVEGGARPWVINSFGDVRGGGRDYVLAIMQPHQPSQSPGFRRASAISQVVFETLAKPLNAPTYLSA